MLQPSITRMYMYLNIILKLDKLGIRIEQTVRVRQVGCMAPVILLLLAMAFSKTIEVE